MEMTSRLADPSARKAILLVDLNNEAPYPTLAIGCLAAPLVNAGFRVDVFSPLAHGIKPFARDQQESFTDYIAARIQFAGTPLLEWAMEFIYQTAMCILRLARPNPFHPENDPIRAKRG